MRAQKYGRIITTTSSAGRYGNHGLSAYGAAKAAVEVLTRSLAFEGEKYNIEVNAISPYAVTQMTEGHMSPKVAAANRIRRAYNVETPSVAIDQNNVAASIDELFTEVGVQHRNSNSAFASLV